MLLALDLSTPQGHLALVDASGVRLERQFTSHRSHNSMLYGPLGEALTEAGGNLRAIVVGTGPGSYTGVRISIAAAQGVAMARGVPVLGVDSLGSLAEAESFAVIGDARRGHWYVGEVCGGRLAGELRVLDADAARAWLDEQGERAIFCSDEALPLNDARVQLAKPDAARLARWAAALSAETLAQLAAAALEPCYVQPAFVTQAKKPFAASALTA